jgi:hypothetical protein
MSEPIDLSNLTPQPEPPITDADFPRPNVDADRKDDRTTFLRGRRNGRQRHPANPTEPPREAPPYRSGMFIQPITELYGAVAMLAMPFSQPVAETVATQARACAEAWDNAAKQSPAVRQLLHSLTTVSVWGQLAVAHAPIGIVILAQTERGQAFLARGVGDRVEEEMKAQDQG